MKVKVRAHGSSANLGPGFDAVAVALREFYDVVEVSEEPDVKEVVLDGVEGPHAHEVGEGENTAVRAVRRLLERLGLRTGIAVRVWKGVPVARGLGSSGASAAAAVVAVKELLRVEISPALLLEAAGEGEVASAGSPHYDNVGASLFGGFTVVARGLNDELRILSIDLDATFVVAVPQVEPMKGKTGVMRSVLPKTLDLGSAVKQWQRVAMLVAAFMRGECRLAGEMMCLDLVAEPPRSKYVPCYHEVRRAALEAGACGVALSGAGPSMLALVEDERVGVEVAKAMREAYGLCGYSADVRVTKPGGPAAKV